MNYIKDDVVLFSKQSLGFYIFYPDVKTLEIKCMFDSSLEAR